MKTKVLLFVTLIVLSLFYTRQVQAVNLVSAPKITI